jgi:uncharacterized lipoprotein
MKKTSLLVALPLLALSGLLLSGCGIFRSHKAWDTAKQEAPLEIPPGLDRPSTTAALAIPPRGANEPTANGAVAAVGAPAGQVSDGFMLTDGPDSVYRRVGELLKDGSLGEVVSQDASTRSYTLNVSAVSSYKKKGFFSRLFGHGKGETSAAKPHQVQVTVGSSGASASEVRAQGDAAAVAKVIDSLKSSLGG